MCQIICSQAHHQPVVPSQQSEFPAPKPLQLFEFKYLDLLDCLLLRFLVISSQGLLPLQSAVGYCTWWLKIFGDDRASIEVWKARKKGEIWYRVDVADVQLVIHDMVNLQGLRSVMKLVDP